ncbi:hypothetical protein ACIF9R_21855 [Streptomyces sp. NPDC086080]|uniref:hypothetical protein n=1 Tax=Streptomyces sp. NPDC086080 TaxID=3365748 RepID=UPI0037D38121
MARFEVHISDEGLADIDGEPLPAGPGRSVHEAVLDRLQQHAEQRGAPVEATVNDGSGTAHFVLQVSPDGSSQVLTPSDPLPSDPDPAADPVLVPEPAVEPAPEPAPRAARAAPAPAPVPVPALASDSAVATAIARAHAHAHAGTTAAPAPADRWATGTTPPPAPLPTDLPERITGINALVSAGRLDEASAQATALRESLTASLGAEYPDALEARAMEAYLAHLRGDHREATVLALSVARIMCRTGDAQAPAALARATAAWQRLGDERAAVVHGGELLRMWDGLRSQGLLPPGHAELADRVRGQLEERTAYA